MFVAQPQISFPQTCSGPGWRVQVWQYLSYNLDHLDVYLISPWMKMSKSLNYLSYNLDPLCLWCSGKPFCPLSHKAQSLPGKYFSSNLSLVLLRFHILSSSPSSPSQSLLIKIITLIVVESLTKKTPPSFSFWRIRVASLRDRQPWYHLQLSWKVCSFPYSLVVWDNVCVAFCWLLSFWRIHGYSSRLARILSVASYFAFMCTKFPSKVVPPHDATQVWGQDRLSGDDGVVLPPCRSVRPTLASCKSVRPALASWKSVGTG